MQTLEIKTEIVYLVANPLSTVGVHYKTELTPLMQEHYQDLCVRFPMFFQVVEACSLNL